ncbi:vitamin K epoxide reductase family protein [Nocardioides sp. Y6]|uniref:Vitamin K epoxide reductase family protein n=1 Tax=Nocardioides malaquae TaxID=2773426 RepID=A0ABR9RRT0_9ACTN|nr:vitamin K epoxide reductase family protein [Nocardioides malaquae]MBE7324264.1 vitamin K epoxide reductase family protein [Nocardioides malaquae]
MTALDDRTPSASVRSPWRADRSLAWWLLVGGMIGLLAAGTLMVEKIVLLGDPTYVPSCSINPVLSCGSVMTTDQAEVFGFPNPLIGVATFPVVAATGAAILAGATFARWYWLGLQAGVTFGIAFVAWLAFQSLYRIGALCPYCMVVWAVVIPTFISVTLRNLGSGAFGVRAASSRSTQTLIAWAAPAMLATYATVLVLIGIRFWDYWSTLL